MNRRLTAVISVAMLPMSIFAGAPIRVPVDPQLGKEIEAAAREAQQAGNYQGALRQYRRWLEVYPNDPAVQAGIYSAMGLTAERAGNDDQAALWTGISHALDPTLDQRIEKDAAATRGDRWAKAMAVMNTIGQTAQTICQMRNCGAPRQPMPPQGMPMYPQAPVGAPGYPMQNQMMPGQGMPGQGMPSSMPVDPNQMQQQVYQGMPQAQPYPQQQGMPGQPMAQPYPQQQAMPGQPQAQPYPQQQGMPGQPQAQPYPQQQGMPGQPTAQPYPQQQAGMPGQQPMAQPDPTQQTGMPGQQPMAQPYPQQAGMPGQQPMAQPYPQQQAGMPGQQPTAQPYPQQQGMPGQQPQAQPYPQQQGMPGQPMAQPYPQQQGMPGQPTAQPYPQQQGMPGQPMAQPYPQQQGMPGQPTAQPYPQQQAGMPGQQPMAQPYPQQQAGMPGQQPMGQPYPQQQAGMRGQPMAQGAPQTANGYPAQYPNTANAYRPASDYRWRDGNRRGAEAKPIRVLHDHSQLGAQAYFEPSCGALLAVDGQNLTFTPSGSEGPLVIPAAEIVEIRMNVAVGRDVGAFHVITKQGLYLHLAPETGDAEQGRADVDELRKQLGLE